MSGSLQRRQPGFLLLEMILALAVFSMAATGFVVALQRMSKTSSLSQDKLQVTRILDSAMSETLSLPVLEPGEVTLPVEGADLELLTLIEPVQGMVNEEGVELQDIMRIRITARWYQNGRWSDRSVETWRYAPMYQP